MTLLWIIITLLCLLALGVFWRSLHSHSILKMESISERNIAIAREKALEIDSAYESGDINKAEKTLARQDLEISLADELASSSEFKDQFRTPAKWTNFVILALLPLLSIGLYQNTSNYFHAPSPSSSESVVSAPPINDKIPTLDKLLPQLEAKINANPSDQQGLFLLAQTYSRIGRYADSAKRYQQLIDIAEPDPDLYANYADVSAMANGQNFTEETASMLDIALAISPQHIKALWLGGLAARQLGDDTKALDYWQDLMPLIADNPEAAAEVQLLIEGVSRDLGKDASTSVRANSNDAAKTEAEKSLKQTAATGIEVYVTIAADLLAQTNINDTVFIFAKAKTGPPMPLAVSRQTVAQLPIRVRLNDAMAMIPNMKISNFDDLSIGARISKSGLAIAQNGDLQSALVNVPNDHSGTVELVIDSIKK